MKRATWSISVRRFDPKTRLMATISEPVEGYQIGPFGIRKIGAGVWALDHIPTGYALGRMDKRSEAVQRAEAFLRFTNGAAAWEFSDPRAITNLVHDAWRHVVIDKEHAA